MDFAANITSFLSYSLPNSVLTGGDANTSFSLLNLASNTLVMGGRFTSGQVLDSLAALANYQAASSGTGIPLPKCHSALTSSGVFLVLGGSQPVRMTCSYMSTRTHVLFSLSLSLCQVIYPQLFGAHNNVWSKDGIVRSFDGVIVSPPAAKYASKPSDLVEKSGSTTRLVSNHRPERGYFAPHPGRIAFVVADKSLPAGNLFSATAKQAVTLYKRLVAENVPGVDADKLANDFGALLEVRADSCARVATVQRERVGSHTKSLAATNSQPCLGQQRASDRGQRQRCKGDSRCRCSCHQRRTLLLHTSQHAQHNHLCTHAAPMLCVTPHRPRAPSWMPSSSRRKPRTALPVCIMPPP